MSEPDDSLGGVVGRFLWLPFQGLGYVFNPRNWLNTSDDMKRDMKAAWAEVADGRPRIGLSVQLSKNSRNLSITIGGFDAGWVGVCIPGYHCKSLLKLKQSAIDQLHKDHPNIWFSNYNKKPKALIEIDVEEVQRRWKGESAIVRQISQRVIDGLHALVKATGVESMIECDSTLADSAGKLLYDSYSQLNIAQKTGTASFGHPDGHWSDGRSDDLVIIIAVKGFVVNKPS